MIILSLAFSNQKLFSCKGKSFQLFSLIYSMLFVVILYMKNYFQGFFSAQKVWYNEFKNWKFEFLHIYKGNHLSSLFLFATELGTQEMLDKYMSIKWYKLIFQFENKMYKLKHWALKQFTIFCCNFIFKRIFLSIFD